MTDYSKMSDFEINKAVAISQGFAPENCDIAKRGSSLVGVDWDEDTGSATKVFDYCNNPSDAWPIIVSGRIGLNFVNGIWRAQSMMTGWIELCHENPLRAAMVVYLMMKESENG
ncbi:phage protein NinX family protein [Hafnia paralvei]|uniref:phage protein NinX family protein n=1 Tax=Hafnia paralvei TaxID=546367 RepID=UPI003CF9BA44